MSMSAPFELHHRVKRGEIQRVRELLRAGAPGGETGVDTYDNRGYTPLMYAVESPHASVDLVRFLLEHGASIHQECSKLGRPYPIVALCLGGGDPRKLALLLDRGANVHYQRGDGYAALLDAVHSHDIVRDPHFVSLLKLLIARGVALNNVTSYKESALRVLSRLGRFDAVGLLLEAGADETQLDWTPLIRAVALGSLADVEKTVESGVHLEETDWWSRTAYLVAVQTGDISKARYLQECGADINARGRCEKPSLFYAIENHRIPMLEWLIEIGIAIEQTDEFHTTPLMAAAECGNGGAVEVLLRAGADVNWKKRREVPAQLVEALLKAGVDVNGGSDGRTAIASAQTSEIAARLLEAGADSADLSSSRGEDRCWASNPSRMKSSSMFRPVTSIRDGRGVLAPATRRRWLNRFGKP